MSGEAQLLLVIAGMHLLGLACAAALLVPALRNGNEPPPPDFGPDDGWGRGCGSPPSPRGPLGGLPLPAADGFSTRILTAPARGSRMASSATRARQAGLWPQPRSSRAMAARSPRASARTRSVTAERSALATVSARATNTVMARKTRTAS